jgi:hypothetical protein
MKKATIIALILLAIPGTAQADRRYFLYTYSPFIDPQGEMEVEAWLTAKSGKQDPSVGTQWEPRAEFEYAIHGRLGAAAYLNYVKQPGHKIKFDSPSIELIYRLCDPGKIAGDPALYLETTERGDELELESKLLLAHRSGPWISGVNLIGEFEFRHNDDEVLPGGAILRNAFAGEISGGIAYELSSRLSLGLESRFRSEHPNFGRQAAALASVGPSVNLRLGEAQFGVAVLPQIWGSPRTSGSRNLDAFERVQIRAVIGMEL